MHHTDPKDTFYCPLTNCLNPLLERIDFWARAERVIARVTPLRRKRDTSLRGQGPGPAWLAEQRASGVPRRPARKQFRAPPIHSAAPFRMD